MARDSIPQPDVAVQDDKGNIARPWYDALLATRDRGVSNTLGLETLNNAIAGKQPLNANLSAIATLIGSGFLRRTTGGQWVLSDLTPDDIPNPFATYLVDHNGDYLTDTDGNYLVSDDGIPVPVEYGGTGATTAATARTNLGAAADSEVVHNTGTETVAGAKTFTSSLTAPVMISRSSPSVGFISTATGSATRTGYFEWYNAAGARAAYFGDADDTLKVITFLMQNSYTLEFVGGNVVVPASITGTPSGGTARPWKLGSVVAAASAFDATRYVEAEINGVAVKLALVT